MKSILACVVLVAAFAKLQAYPADSTYNFEDGMKKTAELIQEYTKKMEDSTGIHSEFDKDKFMKAAKAFNEKLQEIQLKVKEAFDSNIKNLPNAEELKKKLEDYQKQILEFSKTLNSAEAQKSTEKFRDTVIASCKKINESFLELGQKVGLALPAGMQKTMNEMGEESVKSLKILQEKFQKLFEEATNELKKKKA